MQQPFLDAYHLGCAIPSQCNYIVRTVTPHSSEERKRVQEETDYNVFNFPSDLLICDFLTDSGVTAMTDVQWASLFRGDEAYGRNHGYFALLAAVRDVFERGTENPNKLVSNLTIDEPTAIAAIMDEVSNPPSGGFVNGGVHQLVRPNFFLVPQARCAEAIIFPTIKDIVTQVGIKVPKTMLSSPEAVSWKAESFAYSGPTYCIASNGFFDTTAAHVSAAGFEAINLVTPNILQQLEGTPSGKNHFLGNLDLNLMQDLIAKRGPELVMVILTITNNTSAGQPVSMKNIRLTSELCHRHNVPLIFDAGRFAENIYFIRKYEPGYSTCSTYQIAREMFSYCDGFIFGAKRDALSNIGGFFCFRDKGLFHQKFSVGGKDVGVILKEKQILNYGNDSYGGVSGREIMAIASGLYQVMQPDYLERRVEQVGGLALGMKNAGVAGVIMPTAGHAVYLDMNKFFEGTGREVSEFGGLGFVIELIRLYGIRACELGPFAFEWDLKPEAEQANMFNFVRFAIPRNMYNEEHIQYTISCVSELYRNRERIPKVALSYGKNLRLRHMHCGIKPTYHNGELHSDLAL